jgi:3-deoxy-D-manno-octulosonic-acid transferase
MMLLYNFIVVLTSYFLEIPARFLPKIGLFVGGRKKVWSYLSEFRKPNTPLIWMHAASLGEFEQGLPILDQLKVQYPHYQFLITFFSPSGYEVKKDKVTDFGICYLPLDTHSNALKFIELAKPDLALFVKYEVWPNFFRVCAQKEIPLFMISALFKPSQIYFRWYGQLLRNALKQVSHFYVQDNLSAKLLKQLGHKNTTVSGDTRFDRVSDIKKRDNRLEFMEMFKGKRTCLVVGSSWPEDEKVILPFLLEFANTTNLCVVIAPHQTDIHKINTLLQSLGTKAQKFTESAQEDLFKLPILIVDTVGLLTRIYAYADIAYVGGGFATGLHNTLEPAVFGIPVLIGPNYIGFREAEALIASGGMISISNAETFKNEALACIRNPELRKERGALNAKLLLKNKGATAIICQGITSKLAKTPSA